MEPMAEPGFDLLALESPSLDQVQQMAAYVHSSEANLVRFTEQLDVAQEQGTALAVGCGLHVLERYGQAFEKLQAAPDGLEKQWMLAYALRGARRYQEAVEALQKAQDMGADVTKVALERVAILRQAGDLDAAETALQTCNGAEDVNPCFHYQRARLREAQARYEDAIEDYQNAIELSPNYQQALFHIALRSDLSGNEEAAIRYYRQMCVGGRSYVSAMLNLAVLYEDAGEFSRASQCVQKVLACFPNHPRAALFKKDIDSSMTMYFDEEKERRRTRKNQILETPITDFELSVRSRNCLKKMNISTLGDLLRITEAELLSYKNFGETSLREIKAILDMKGLNLGMALEDKLFARGEVPEAEVDADQGMLAKPVEDLQLSVRARKCLVKLNIRTIGDITRTTDAELLGCKNFGVTSLNEINKGLASLGLSLRRLD